MPQSLSNIIIHLVFSTKERRALLDDSWRPNLHQYITGILRSYKAPLLRVNSASDHIHIAFQLPRTENTSHLVKEIKVGSSVWIKQNQNEQLFQWQQGYGAFSVSPNHVDGLIKYIDDQQIHHQKISFQDEFRHLLNRYHVDFDERYVWD
jgi:REP element-mobilizing transposase RayT